MADPDWVFTDNRLEREFKNACEKFQQSEGTEEVYVELVTEISLALKKRRESITSKKPLWAI